MDDTTTEYKVWYDAADGARRSLNATDTDGVQRILVDLETEAAQRQLLAESIGLNAAPHDYNITVLKVTTTTETVALQPVGE